MKANAPEKIWMDSEWIPHFDCKDCITENSVEYIREDAFIEKAKSWFIQQHTGMWNEFKNYMKGE